MARKSGNEAVTPIILLVIGSIIILAVVIWQTIRVLDKAGTAVQPTATPVSFLPYPDVPRLSLTDAKAVFDAGTATFIDVRGDPSYSISHIPGALDIAYADVQTGMSKLQKDQHLILYCT